MQKLPAIKTISFSAPVDQTVKQGFNKRYIDISVPFGTTEPPSRGHSQQAREELGAPPPSPDYARPEGELSVHSELEILENDHATAATAVAGDIVHDDGGNGDISGNREGAQPHTVTDSTSGEIQSGAPLDVSHAELTSTSVQEQSSNGILIADSLATEPEKNGTEMADTNSAIIILTADTQ
jgi:hypothetical protein